MTQIEGGSSKFPVLSPCLTVRDPGAAMDFYQRAFGFDKREAIPGPDGKIVHVEMVYQSALIMFGPECPTEPQRKPPASSGVSCPLTLYVYCADVDALCARAQKAGAKVIAAPADMFWGDRVCRLQDPDGYAWMFATHTGKQFAPPW
jgi:uncharacterized glyoxalase superfamily protein PhnB